MSQSNSRAGIDEQSMGSIKNNPFLKGSIKKPFQRKSSTTQESEEQTNKISGILDKWNRRQSQIEKNYNKKPEKKNIYADNPDHRSQEWINPQLKPGYKKPEDDEKSTNERVVATEITTQPIKQNKTADPLKETNEELRLTRSKLSNCKQKTDALIAENNSLKFEIETLNRSNSEFEEKNNKLNVRIIKLQTSLESAEEQHLENKSNKENDANKEIVALKEHIKSLQRELATNQDANGDNRERQKLINCLQKRIEENEAEISNIKREKNEEIVQLTQENTRKVHEIKQYKQQIEALENELRNIRNANKNLSQSVENVNKNEKKQVRELRMKLLRLREDKDNKIIELSDMIEEREKDLKEDEKYISQLKKRNIHLNKKNEQLMMENGELNEDTQKMEALMVKLKKLQTENKELKKLNTKRVEYDNYNYNYNEEYVDMETQMNVTDDVEDVEDVHDDNVPMEPPLEDRTSNEEDVDNAPMEQYIDVENNENYNDNAPMEQYVDVINEEFINVDNKKKVRQ